MRKEVVLITGANGEMGHGLISHLSKMENKRIKDWSWMQEYSMEKAFSEYLIPAVQKRYLQNPKA